MMYGYDIGELKPNAEEFKQLLIATLDELWDWAVYAKVSAAESCGG